MSDISMNSFKKFFNKLGWNKTSYTFLSVFILLLFLIGYVWWPLVEEYLSTYDHTISFWRQMDYLLLGNFLVMTLLIMSNANIRKDLPIVFIGLAGGLVIEGWGTQTSIWSYYTNERPPLWIIPAWPIASLSIDRLYRLLNSRLKHLPESIFKWLYWILFPTFLSIMLAYIWPTLDKSLTRMALFLCVFLIVTPRNSRTAVLVFTAGAGLGFFLELWGTTRLCWTYYTLARPPFFAVLAHGMAAYAFWRVLHLYQLFFEKSKQRS